MKALTSHESSILAYLAQRPRQASLDEFKAALSPDALLIAKYLAHVETNVPEEVKTTAEAIRTWARERTERERALISVLGG